MDCEPELSNYASSRPVDPTPSFVDHKCDCTNPAEENCPANTCYCHQIGAKNIISNKPLFSEKRTMLEADFNGLPQYKREGCAGTPSQDDVRLLREALGFGESKARLAVVRIGITQDVTNLRDGVDDNNRFLREGYEMYLGGDSTISAIGDAENTKPKSLSYQMAEACPGSLYDRVRKLQAVHGCTGKAVHELNQGYGLAMPGELPGLVLLYFTCGQKCWNPLTCGGFCLVLDTNSMSACMIKEKKHWSHPSSPWFYLWTWLDKFDKASGTFIAPGVENDIRHIMQTLQYKLPNPINASSLMYGYAYDYVANSGTTFGAARILATHREVDWENRTFTHSKDMFQSYSDGSVRFQATEAQVKQSREASHQPHMGLEGLVATPAELNNSIVELMWLSAPLKQHMIGRTQHCANGMPGIDPKHRMTPLFPTYVKGQSVSKNQKSAKIPVKDFLQLLTTSMTSLPYKININNEKWAKLLNIFTMNMYLGHYNREKTLFEVLARLYNAYSRVATFLKEVDPSNKAVAHCTAPWHNI